MPRAVRGLHGGRHAVKSIYLVNTVYFQGKSCNLRIRARYLEDYEFEVLQ